MHAPLSLLILTLKTVPREPSDIIKVFTNFSPNVPGKSLKAEKFTYLIKKSVEKKN